MKDTTLAGREPLVIRTALVTAVATGLNAVVLLGLVDLTNEQQGGIVTAVGAIAALAIVLLVRPKVTPVATPVATPTIPEAALNAVVVTGADGTEVPNLAVVARSASKYSSDNKSDAAYHDGETQL